MKTMYLLLALPVIALTGCSTYVGDAGPGPGYYGGAPVVYDDGYYGGPSVDVGVGYYGYNRGGGYYEHDYHHTDNNYRSGAVASNYHTNSFHAANTRVASSNVSHASGHAGGASHTASASAGHSVL
jgi:hypothetical protein